ncbi:MAG: hypothetical protein LBT40_16240 [Deltaproteobacteria bacterium]|jgi:hypothetical protein|nr:hypothetical protein [Deltaproteobacteria bacterium]
MLVSDIPASVVLNQIIRQVEEKGTLEKVRRIMTAIVSHLADAGVNFKWRSP